MKTAKIGPNGEIDLEVFADFLDITKIKYYSLELLPKHVHVVFYDKNKKKLKIKSKR